MENAVQGKGVFWRLCLAFFFQGMASGFWIPALTNILNAHGYGAWIAWAFAVLPVCSLITPVIGGALADEKIAAQKLFAWSSLLAAVLIALAFACLHIGLPPVCFLLGLAAYGLATGPSWGLLATISLTHLQRGEREFPLVRLGATFGWVAGGLLTSHLLHADSSPVAGYAAAVAFVCAGCTGFFLPNTPPLGTGKTWKSALGLGGFVLFKNRDHAALFLVTGLFSIPLAAFYMFSPELFKDLGDKSPTASMTAAQWTEVFAMFFLGALMLKFRFKTLLMWGLGLSALRFGLSGYAGLTGIFGWHLAGVALHGVCYTLYFITAQVYMNKRVEPRLRGQAQGLLNLMTAGVGPLVGAFFCGWLRDYCVDDQGRGWENFWWTLSAIIVGCMVVFALLYKGKRAEA